MNINFITVSEIPAGDLVHLSVNETNPHFLLLSLWGSSGFPQTWKTWNWQGIL